MKKLIQKLRDNLSKRADARKRQRDAEWLRREEAFMQPIRDGLARRRAIRWNEVRQSPGNTDL